MLWIKFLTWFKGELVGEDDFGNKYYREKGPKSLKERRWVIYKGIVESSKVPAEWHGWLHHTALTPPTVEQRKRWPWERNSLPNLSGTSYAYHPVGWGGKRNKITKGYQAWEPHKVKDENKST